MPTLKYNDVEIFSFQTTSIQARPVLDEAQRTVIYVETVLEVKGYVTGSNEFEDEFGAQNDMENLRVRLTKQAARLQYDDQGWGESFDVNPPGGGGMRDVKWGPVPELITFRPLGGYGVAAAVTFRVKCHLPYCEGAKFKTDGGTSVILALNVEHTFEIDKVGMTTERTSGYLEIPATRKAVGDRTMPDCVDRFRPILEARRPVEGFRRHSQVYKVSKDKRRLDFSYVDEQIPAALPERVALIEARELSRSQPRSAMRIWQVTFTATITMAAGVPKTESLGVFFLVVNSKVPFQGGRNTPVLLPTGFEIDDDVFGMSTRYTITYHYADPISLTTMLRTFKFWQPIANTSYALWRASMLFPTRPFTSRGQAGLELTAAEDVIIDVCPGSQASSTAAAPRRVNGRQIEVMSGGDERPASPNPDPSKTWLEWTAFTRYREWSNAVTHKRLPDMPTPTPPPVPGARPAPPPLNPAPSEGITSGVAPGSFQGVSPDLQGPPPRKTAPPAVSADLPGPSAAAAVSVKGPAVADAMAQGPFPVDANQYTTNPDRVFELYGYASRVGYRVVIPMAVSVGGIPAVEVYRDVMEGDVGIAEDVRIYWAAWRITYTLPAAPAFIPTIPNPQTLTNGTIGPG